MVAHEGDLAVALVGRAVKISKGTLFSLRLYTPVADGRPSYSLYF